MKKRSIILITGLMALALLGVMAMQFYFLRQSYHLQSELFDRSVNEALNNVVSKISKQDALNFLKDKVKYQSRFVKQTHDTVHGKIKTVYNYSNISDGQGSVEKRVKVYSNRQSPGKNMTRTQRITKLKDSLNHIYASTRLENDLEEMGGSLNFQIKVEEFTDEYGHVQQNLTPQIVTKPITATPFKRPKGRLQKYIDTQQYVYIDPQFGRQVVSVPRLNPLWQREQEKKKKELEVKKIRKLLQVEAAVSPDVSKSPKTDVIEKIAQEYQRTDEPLKQRINSLWIDTLLRFELLNKGISLPFSYEVLTANNDSLIYSNAMETNGNKPVFIEANSYQTPIFNQQVINDPGKIKISFPQKNSLILSSMAATMTTTAGLLFILIFCFGYTIYSILKQKKISEMKTDFINNMTHEFKTPVSTIMIASEALKDEEIAEDKSRVAKLAGIIYEENVRLGSHIERVLNIARIEKNDFKLDIKKVDVNEMIVTVLDSMSLKLQKHEVKMDLTLCDGELNIKADELHFSNVIYNLIDNAIKYSQGIPQITMTTQVRGNHAIIKVADKGIGMNTDQQSKIFEQFYRIPTGNLHDVKGFGLGLSYVNTIVKRLNGTIGVKSEKDKGSEFELRFDRC